MAGLFDVELVLSPRLQERWQRGGAVAKGIQRRGRTLRMSGATAMLRNIVLDGHEAQSHGIRLIPRPGVAPLRDGTASLDVIQSQDGKEVGGVRFLVRFEGVEPAGSASTR